MFIEVSPGTGRVVPEGGDISVANTLPDIDPDEILRRARLGHAPLPEAADLGGGRGAARPRRRPARGVPAPRAGPPRPGPRHARDRRAPGRAEAARPPLRAADDASWGAIRTTCAGWSARRMRCSTRSRASEQEHLDVGRASCPGALRATERAPASRCRASRPLLQQHARVAARAGPPAARHQRGAHAVLQPTRRRCCATRSGRSCAPRGRSRTTCAWPRKDLAQATPDLTTSLQETNRFFNMGAYNPGGAESLAGSRSPSSAPATRASSTGWPGRRRTASRCSRRADAQGPWRRVTICGVPGPILDVDHRRRAEQRRVKTNPALVEQLIGGPGTTIQPGSPIENLLAPGSAPATSGRRRHEQEPADTRADRRDGRVHAVGVRPAAVPVDLVRRRRAAQGQGLPLQGGLPRGRAARQGGGRPDGRREHRQGQGDGAGPGRPDARAPRWRSTTASRRSRWTPARSCARRACSARPTSSWRRASPTPKALPDGGTLARTNVDDTVQLDEVFRAFDPRRGATSRSGCTSRASRRRAATAPT